MGIRNKLFIWISATFLLAIGLLSYFSIPWIERIVFDHETNVMSAKTEQVAGELDDRFVKRGAILKSMAIQMEIGKLDDGNPQLPTFINSMAEHFNDEFHGIFTGFANGIHVSTGQVQLPPGFDPTTRQWYIDAMRENGLVVTEPYQDIKTGLFVSSIAYPVRTSIPGVIGTDIYSDELHLSINEGVFDSRSKVFLLSRTGTLLYANDDSIGTLGENFVVKENGLFHSWVERMIAGEKGFFQFAWHGVVYYGLFVPIPTAGWSLAVVLPMSVLYEENESFIIHIAIVVLMGIAALFLAIYIIIRKITKPLEVISLTAQKVSNGDLTVKFQHSGTAEVEYLTHSLELMRTNMFSLLENKEGLIEETRAQNEEIEALYGQMKALNEDLKLANQEKEIAYSQTIKALAEAIEAKDDYTRGHSDRVLGYSEKIGLLLGWGEEQLKVLRYAAILHDIGKIGVPLKILNKPGRLEPEEYEKIKLHPELGYRIIHKISYLDSVSIAVLQHHERIDGLGYPNGLKDSDISPFAKVIMVADTYDAMTSERPYRKAMTAEVAVQELQRCAGTQFDVAIVQVFCEKVLLGEGCNPLKNS